MSARDTALAFRLGALAVFVATMLVAWRYGSLWLSAGFGLGCIAAALVHSAAYVEQHELRRQLDRIRRPRDL